MVKFTTMTKNPIPVSSEQTLRTASFYYGWVNVILASVAMSGTFPGRTYGLGLIKDKLTLELGISDLSFNVLNFWAIIIGAIVVVPVGRMIDRLGTRLTLGIVTAILGASVLAMAQVTGETGLAITLTLVRGFGQGALSVVAIALVGKWFRKRAGIAMGVFTLLLSIGFLVPIGVIGSIVTSSGWRTGWNVVGYSLLFGLLPLGLLFARSSPESYGVKPDDPAPNEGHVEPMTTRQTLITLGFWVYSGAATVFNLTFSALTLDNAQLLREHQMDPNQTNNIVLGILMLMGFPANIVTGLLARSLPLGKILGVGVLILALSLAMFPFVTTPVGAGIYAGLLGVSGGVITVIYFSVYGHTYGRTHMGSIQSVVQVLSVLASAIGPVILAYIREKNEGNTSPFFYLFAGITLVFAIAVWVVRPPKRTLRPSESQGE